MRAFPSILICRYPLDCISNESTYVAALVTTTAAGEDESVVASWVLNLGPPGPDHPTSIAHLTGDISKYKYRSVYQSFFLERQCNLPMSIRCKPLYSITGDHGHRMAGGGLEHLPVKCC